MLCVTSDIEPVESDHLSSLLLLIESFGVVNVLCLELQEGKPPDDLTEERLPAYNFCLSVKYLPSQQGCWPLFVRGAESKWLNEHGSPKPAAACVYMVSASECCVLGAKMY